MIALSNGNISFGNLPLFDNKNKDKTNSEESKRNKERKSKGKSTRKQNKKSSNNADYDIYGITLIID